MQVDTTVEDEAEAAAATHVAGRHVVGIDHAGQLTARGHLPDDAFHDQSMQAFMRAAGRVALWPAGSWTSMDTECDDDRISKIRARHLMRNDELYTATAADRGASATREQEVVHRKVGHTPRHLDLRR